MSKQDNLHLVDVLQELKRTNTRAAKAQIIKDNAETPYFKDALKFLLDSFEVVGISTKKIQKDLSPIGDITELPDILKYLSTHSTGKDEDVATVKGFLSTFDDEDPIYRETFTQLITKTLSLGVSAKTVNEQYGDKFISTFSVQLAFQYNKKISTYDDESLFYVTQKLDGHRALTIVEPIGNRIGITTYTRKGQQYDGLTELHTNIMEFLKQNIRTLQFPQGFILDGELLLQNSDNSSTVELFQKTSKVLRSDGEKHNINYNIFDMLPLDEFLYREESKETYAYRRTHWLDELKDSDLLHVIPVLDVIHKDRISEMSSYATKHQWEGVMLNYSEGKYKKTRSPQLLKVKKMHTADLEIVGFNIAQDGKFVGEIKSIDVRLDSKNIVHVGSGIPDDVRVEILEHREQYLGKMVEIQYFEETTNANGGHSLRFPIFKGFRDDKTPEDANID